MFEDRNFKSGTNIDHGRQLTVQNYVKRGHVTYFWNFGTSSISWDGWS